MYMALQALLAIFGSSLAIIITLPAIKEALGSNSDLLRIVAAAFAGSGSAAILYHYLREKIRTMPLLFKSGHVIISGLNYHSSLIIRDLVRRKIKPVIIESNADNTYIESCTTMGLITLIGDPSDPVMLKRANAKKAGNILSLSDVDEDNAEVALTVMQMVPATGQSPLTCTIQVLNPQLYGIIRKHAFSTRKDSSVRIEFFNQYALGARMLLERHPPFFQNEPPAEPATVLIIGAGRLGDSLMTRIARTWYQAHRTDRTRLRLTLLDVQAEQIRAGLLLQSPKIAEACDLVALPLDVRSAEFRTGAFLKDPRFQRDFTAYVCLDDDSLGLYAALTLHPHTAGRNVRFVVRMDHNTSVAKLIADEQVGLRSIRDILPVNMYELTANSQLILAGEEEILARAIHENYCNRERLKGQTRESNRLLVSWDELGTLTARKDGLDGKKYQESNRRQANFIWTKLSVVGCSIGPVTDWDAPDTFRFSSEEIESLARLEHERWMDEKTNSGWRYGSLRDDARKLHPSLIPYDQLSEPEKEKDRDTIRQIPGLLSRIDFQVNREAGIHQGAGSSSS